MTTTDRATVVEAGRGAHGYRTLRTGPGEPHLRPDGSAAAAPAQLQALLTVVHLSDLHLCDGQSPARAEFIDRLSDPDSPFAGPGSSGGNYRTNELLTAQVVEAMVRAVNEIDRGPVGGGPVDIAITTGDVTDSAQANEVSWYLQLLDGGQLRPDSGDPAQYEGVMDEVVPDPHYWHPEPGGTADHRRTRYGFPDAPGLLTAAREPLQATGLDVPWLAVYGNHDAQPQGVVDPTAWPGEVATGTAKATGLPATWTEDETAGFLWGFNDSRLPILDRWAELPTRQVTADPARRILSRQEFVAAHDRPDASPDRHGFAADGADLGRAWYRHDQGPVTILVLDTVNECGHWQGRLDREQFQWLATELTAADAERRYVLLASHHRLTDLTNDRRRPGAPAPVLTGELAAELARHPSLVLWLNGHSHATLVTEHDGWWELTAPSLIDFPQQARIVELLRAPGGQLWIAGTMIDHAGEVSWSGSTDTVPALAGLSRELAANDWQYPAADLVGHPLVGRPTDRNVLLQLPDPFPG